ILEKCDRLEQAIGAPAFGLLGRTAVKTPHRQILQRQFLRIAIDDLGFAAEVRDRRVTVEPDVFEFEFGHKAWVAVTGLVWVCGRWRCQTPESNGVCRHKWLRTAGEQPT